MKGLSKMATVNICGHPSSDCCTIDRTSDPVLNNARKVFPGAMSHADVEEVRDNLLSCLPPQQPQRAMIVGHGESGTILTGSGDTANDQDQRISIDNIPIWTPALQNLAGHITELTLCACDTGADPNGATLLKEVANVIGARVYGFTALIYIGPTGNITCDPKAKGKWIYAAPGKPLPPVPIPSVEFQKMLDLKLKYGDEYRTVKINDVSGASLFDPAHEDKRVASLERTEAQRLVGTINFTEPSEIDGAPLAVKTGIVEIEYLIENKRDARTFQIFNDRLLYDQSTPNTFYYASPNLAKTLDEFRPESPSQSR